MLRIDKAAGLLFDDAGRRFAPASRTWAAGHGQAATGAEADLLCAVKWLQRSSGSPCRVPIGVIGAREATADHLVVAEDIGRRLAELGLTVLCGGRQGAMEAACRGVAAAGGLSVGILPEGDPASANPYVTVPIATGIGIARNAIVARAALCLVAIGGGHGTISEAAFGLQFEKAVFCLGGGPLIPGVRPCRGIDEAIEGVARVVLGLPLPPIAI